MMKRVLSIGLAVLLSLGLAGCRKEKVQIVNDTPAKNGIKLELSGHKGKMTYELEDAYWTQNPKACGIDMQKIDPYSFVEVKKSEEIEDVPYPEYFVDKSQEKLIDNCKMYVCKIKVTNVDAKYYAKDMYENPYIFRADNLFLNYINEESEKIQYKTVDYYSLRRDGDHTWSTYELHPGESITYELAFVVGDIIDGVDLQGEDEQFYLGNTTGSTNGKYYRIDWSER